MPEFITASVSVFVGSPLYTHCMGSSVQVLVFARGRKSRKVDGVLSGADDVELGRDSVGLRSDKVLMMDVGEKGS